MRSSRVIPAFAITMTAGLMLTTPVAAQRVSEVTVTAHAPAGTEVRHEAVKFSDLDLQSPTGAETFLGRVRGAAGRVCMPGQRRRDLRDTVNYRTCREEAVSGAVKASGSDMVKQVFDRTGD